MFYCLYQQPKYIDNLIGFNKRSCLFPNSKRNLISVQSCSNWHKIFNLYTEFAVICWTILLCIGVATLVTDPPQCKFHRRASIQLHIAIACDPANACIHLRMYFLVVAV